MSERGCRSTGDPHAGGALHRHRHAEPRRHGGHLPPPDSQLDRFSCGRPWATPAPEVEKRILDARRGRTVETIQQAVTLAQLVEAQREVDAVQVDDAIIDYAHAVVRATRAHDGSRRASRRARAGVPEGGAGAGDRDGRSYAIPDDVRAGGKLVLAHRVRVSGADAGVGQWTATAAGTTPRGSSRRSSSAPTPL